MGVPRLWNALQPFGHDAALPHLADVLAEQAGGHQSGSRKSTDGPSSKRPAHPLRLGIDIAGWLFHAQKSQGGKSPQLRNLFYRMCRLLGLPYILPVFVFDGPQRPAMKRGKCVATFVGERDVGSHHSEPDEAEKMVASLARFIQDVKRLIDAFGFVWIDAPGEAEAELADLNQRGLLDAIMTDDSDSLVFGAKLIVRFWGHNLSGTKARSKFLAEGKETTRERSSSPLFSKSSDIDGTSPTSQSSLPGQSGAHTSSVNASVSGDSTAYFDAREIRNSLALDRGGMVLIALLSGGDYDVKGLPKCGVKIAMALARAGFGKELLDGAKQHLRPPAAGSFRYGRPPSPSPLDSWDAFLADWRYRLCDELKYDRQGFIGRKLKQLAKSDDICSILSTSAALAVMATYIWPVVSARKGVIQPSAPLDISTLATFAQQSFGWGLDRVLDSFRNNVWPGCIQRYLLRQPYTRSVSHTADDGEQRPGTATETTMPERSSEQPTCGGRDSRTNRSISSFFGRSPASKALIKSGDVDVREFSKDGLIQSVTAERCSADRDTMRDFRVQCKVSQLVELTRKDLLDDATLAERREEARGKDLGKQADDGAYEPLQISPRKQRTFIDPSKPLRIWIAEDVVAAHPEGAAAIKDWHRRVSEKEVKKKREAELKSVKDREKVTQPTLSSFFGTTLRNADVVASPPQSALIASAGIAPDKSSAPRELHVSPTKRKAAYRGQEGALPSSISEQRVEHFTLSSPSHPPRSVMVSRAEPHQQEGEKRDDRQKEDSLASNRKDTHKNLLAQSLPSATLRAQADDSVEFVSRHMVTRRSQQLGKPADVIVVSDDSSDDNNVEEEEE